MNDAPEDLPIGYAEFRIHGIELYDHLQVLEAGEDIPAIMISAILPRREIAQRH